MVRAFYLTAFLVGLIAGFVFCGDNDRPLNLSTYLFDSYVEDYERVLADGDACEAARASMSVILCWKQLRGRIYDGESRKMKSKIDDYRSAHEKHARACSTRGSFETADEARDAKKPQSFTWPKKPLKIVTRPPERRYLPETLVGATLFGEASTGGD